MGVVGTVPFSLDTATVFMTCEPSATVAFTVTTMQGGGSTCGDISRRPDAGSGIIGARSGRMALVIRIRGKRFRGFQYPLAAPVPLLFTVTV